MDFPKSVPGVGLVGDRFVDEDPAIGRQGSLIPSVWGNAVTLELLNVIEAAGLDPSEAQTDQLLEAIRALVPERSAFARVTGTQALSASAFGIYALADDGAAATVTLPSTADLVDDTELLLFANHANTAAVQVKAGAGQTVQGPVALMGVSTTAFMLPGGGDWVRLRSEKAQGRWVVVSSYANARMDMIDARVAATEGAITKLPVGTTWVDKKAVRAFNTTYTNNKPYDLEVSIGIASITNGSFSCEILIDGLRHLVPQSYAPSSGATIANGCEFTVPAGKTYSANSPINCTLNVWREKEKA